MKVAELKTYADLFTNDGEQSGFMTRKRIKEADVLYGNLADYSANERSKFSQMLKRAHKRIVVYIKDREDLWEEHFNRLGYHWEFVGEFVYVVDKYE